MLAVVFLIASFHLLHQLAHTNSLKTLICRLATPATFLLSTNDPSGFNLIDVLAYGSLGHALGYFILATNSLQANHVPTL